jgi:hypothetical protein
MKLETIVTPIKTLSLFTVACTLAFAANFAYGQWSSPTAAPVGGNVEAPVNIGPVLQHKQGNLRSDEFHSTNYCDENGGNCIDHADLLAAATGGGGVGTGLGYNQTWRFVNRTQYVWYQNDTGQPIMVLHKNVWDGTSVLVGPSTGSYVELNFIDFDSDLDNTSTFIVPPGHWYNFRTLTGNSSDGARRVLELR